MKQNVIKLFDFTAQNHNVEKKNITCENVSCVLTLCRYPGKDFNLINFLVNILATSLRSSCSSPVLQVRKLKHKIQCVAHSLTTHTDNNHAMTRLAESCIINWIHSSTRSERRLPTPSLFAFITHPPPVKLQGKM